MKCIRLLHIKLNTCDKFPRNAFIYEYYDGLITGIYIV